jgi:hypothetical protein
MSHRQKIQNVASVVLSFVFGIAIIAMLFAIILWHYGVLKDCIDEVWLANSQLRTHIPLIEVQKAWQHQAGVLCTASFGI